MKVNTEIRKLNKKRVTNKNNNNDNKIKAVTKKGKKKKKDRETQRNITKHDKILMAFTLFLFHTALSPKDQKQSSRGVL